jgi:hypothetical protein
MGHTINDSDNRYNGWTNYATWRVNLEIFDGFDPREYWGGAIDSDAYDLGDFLKGHVEELIEQTSGEGLARDYALAFLSDVNWREIAEHMLDEIKADAA